jgi:peptidyl-prolyl cis-trans isomerase SurA
VENKRLAKKPEAGTPEEPQIVLKQAFIPIKGKTDTEAELINRQQLITSASQGINSCKAFGAFSQKIRSTIKPEAISTKLSALNKSIQTAVKDLPENKISPVLRSKKGLHVFMVCERTAPSTAPVMDKRQIKEEIFRQRLDLMARQFMRDLRRQTYIEVKL